MTTLNATHDPALRSWVASANAAGCDFPIQNLPFGRFPPRRQRGSLARRRRDRRPGARPARPPGLIGRRDDMNAADAPLNALRPSAARWPRRGIVAACARAATKQARVAQRAAAAGTGRVRPALPHRRLHRLLHRHPPRHRGRQAVPARQPAAAQLQVGADRLPRARLVASL